MSQYFNSNSDKDCKPDTVVEPEYNGYQLIGDSQFLRFSEQILKQKRKKSNGLAYLGLCVSGQRISDLLERVKSNFYPTSKDAILMIGTNDLFKSTPAHDMCEGIEKLLKKLIERGVQTLILLTIPPVPRLTKSVDHWNRLREYNDKIRDFHNDIDVFVIDAYSKFVMKRSPERSSIHFRISRSPTHSRDSTSPICSRHSPHSSSDSVERRPERESRGSPNDESLDCSSTSDWINSPTGSPGKTTSLPKVDESRVSLKVPNDPEGFVEGNRIVCTATKEGCGDGESRESDSEALKSFPIVASGSRKRKRSGPVDDGDSPTSKRSSLNHSNVEEDHDDGFCEVDSRSQINVNNADEVNREYFEEWFNRRTGLKDLIHLNCNGLHVIKGLIDEGIRNIREK